MGRKGSGSHSPATLKASSKPLTPQSDESWLQLSVAEEEDGLLEEVCMEDESGGVGVVKSRSCTLTSACVPHGPLSASMGDAAVQAVTGLKGLLLLWMFGDACSRGGERLHGWAPCLCVVLGAQAAIQHTRSTAQGQGWKGRVWGVCVWLLPLYWLGLVMCLWPIHIARTTLPPPPITVEAPSPASLGSVPWYVRQWEVLLVLLGAQAWGLSPTPPQSPELWKARTGAWGHMSIQLALLLAYPLLHPLVAATAHRAGGVLRRCGGLVGLGLVLCLCPVLLQAAYPHTTTTPHSVWGVVLLLPVCVPWLLTGALTVLDCRDVGGKASESPSPVRVSGMALDGLALTAVALAYAPLPTPLQHAAYWVLLPWLCSVVVHGLLQPSVRYSSVLGCHVIGLSPLQALGGPLAAPLMATYTGVTDVWLPGLVLALQGLPHTQIAHYITQAHGIRGLGVGVSLFALLLSWTLAAGLHHTIQGCLCARLCPSLAPPLPLPPPLAPAPSHRGSSSSLSRAMCFVRPVCVALCLVAPVLPSATRGDESEDEDTCEVEMGQAGARTAHRHGRKLSVGQEAAVVV